MAVNDRRKTRGRAGMWQSWACLRLPRRISKSLRIWKTAFVHWQEKIGKRDWEGEAYVNLGVACLNLSDVEQATEYYKLHLCPMR